MNIKGTLTLIKKETLRNFKVYNQTIVSPVISGLLFFTVFAIAFHGQEATNASTIAYRKLIATGLIIMSLTQACYASAQSSVTISKVIGFILDFLVAPLSLVEIIIASVISATIRAFVVGTLMFIALLPFVNIIPQSIGIAFLFFLLSALLFSMIGFAIGTSVKGFDSAQAYTIYLVTPLTMLSGTFYSIKNLPVFWQNLIQYNPVLYLIEGFRWGIYGESTSNWYLGTVILFISFMLVTVSCYLASKTRYAPIRI